MKDTDKSKLQYDNDNLMNELEKLKRKYQELMEKKNVIVRKKVKTSLLF